METDTHYINETLKLALLGLGRVSPNPMVGALIVKNGNIIARGYHKAYGTAHAELDAIQNAQQSLEDATLYCNLEPCHHTNKQTPPCVQRIINEKITRVVISHRDPNPLVNGKGVSLLRASGIHVTENIEEKRAQELNEVFSAYIIKQRPFIHLKWAQSLDGKIATVTKNSKWISNEMALDYVHYLRYKYDAVLIGQNTFVIDDPHLTARRNGYNKIPWRIVLASLNTINTQSNLIIKNPEKTIYVITYEEMKRNQEYKKQLQNLGIQIITADQDCRGYIELTSLLNELKRFQISSILVEGGSSILTSFFQKNLWDRISIFIAPLFIGTGIDALGDLSVSYVRDAPKYTNQIVIEELDDVLHYQIKKREEQ